MTIDERIEKLTERHEALAQSVELLTAQNEATRKVVDAMVEGINGLLRIVTSHEKRLSELEGS
jgi:hypothetical protein